MKINRNDLLQGLEAVKPGLAKKDIIEQMTHFIFTGKNIVTYNDKICVSYPFETDFTCSIFAEDIYKVLSRIKTENIIMKIKDDSLLVSTKKTKLKLALLLEYEISEMLRNLEKEVTDKWLSVSKDFLEGLFLCMFSASKDQTEGSLICINVSENNLFSSDKVRASHFTMDKKMRPFLLVASSIPSLINLKINQYSVTKNWLHFLNEEGVRISVRNVIGNYPDYSDIIKVDGDKFEIPETLKDSLQTTVIMAKGDTPAHKAVDISIKNNMIFCNSSKEGGEITELVDFKYEGDPVSFRINPFFLIQVLENATKMTIGKDRGLFESDKFRHILMFQQEV